MALRIGDILKNAGIVSDDMIKFALTVQKATGTRLGDTLKDLKLATDADIARVLSQQAGLGYSDMVGVVPDAMLLKKIPRDIAMRLEILPISELSNETMVMVADPFDENMKGKIGQFIFGKINFVVASRVMLLRAIEHHYYLADHPIDEEIEKISEAAKQGRPFQVEKLVDLIIRSAIDHRASDVHINATGLATLISFRIDGVLQLVYSLVSSIHSRIVSVVKVESSMDVAERHRPQDGRSKYVFLQDSYDLRVSVVPTVHGENIVIRILSGSSQIKSLEELGYNEAQLVQIKRMAASPFGMILVVGPTGSGKSTTLYSVVRKINLLEKNLMTIEDPVEYNLPLVKQVAVNEKAGITFSTAIRGFLRQDPDVILIGEVRDKETSHLAVSAAQTGHLVLTTVHANDAVGAISRLSDLDIGNFLIASSLTGVIAQRLIRRLCDKCKDKVLVDPQEKEKLGLTVDHIFKHKGCTSCRSTGYAGRTVVAEIMEIDTNIREMIDRGDSQIEIKRATLRQGARSIVQSGVDLLHKGVIDLEEFYRVIKVDDVLAENNALYTRDDQIHDSVISDIGQFHDELLEVEEQTEFTLELVDED